MKTKDEENTDINELRALWCEEKSKAMTFHAEVERLRAEVAALKAERDALQLRWQRLYGEIDCRIEHGASSNGHLEAIRKMMQKEGR